MSGLRTLVLIILYAVFSWVLVHLLAVLGLFIALAYPIWWALIPEKTICFSCRSVKHGKKCRLCKKTVDIHDERYPHVSNLRSAILNALLIVLFTFVSLGIVFGEMKLLNSMGFPATPKTVSFVIPAKGQYRLGEIFPMRIEIVGIETPINAIQADISFDPAIVEVVDINTAESFANVFIQKEINNEAGYARLTGGLPNPGFFSDRGVFGTVWFRSKIPGIVKVDFLPTSMVLANDGHGTNVLKEFTSVSYLILPESINKDEAEMQKRLITMRATDSQVLGEQTNRTQIRLYAEGSVLGTRAVNETSEASESGVVQEETHRLTPWEWFAHMVEKFDSFVFEQFSKLLGLSKD